MPKLTYYIQLSQTSTVEPGRNILLLITNIDARPQEQNVYNAVENMIIYMDYIVNVLIHRKWVCKYF